MVRAAELKMLKISRNGCLLLLTSPSGCSWNPSSSMRLPSSRTRWRAKPPTLQTVQPAPTTGGGSQKFRPQL